MVYEGKLQLVYIAVSSVPTTSHTNDGDGCLDGAELGIQSVWRC